MSGKYAAIIHTPRPVHHQDEFAFRHPPMDRRKRAKLFAAFDALAGYDEALAEQEVIYVERELLSESKLAELDEKLNRLWQAYHESKSGVKYLGGSELPAQFEAPVVTVRYFEEAPGQAGRGLYHTVTGRVMKLDLVHGDMLVEEEGASTCDDIRMLCLSLSDIFEYEGRIFEQEPDEQ